MIKEKERRVKTMLMHDEKEISRFPREGNERSEGSRGGTPVRVNPTRAPSRAKRYCDWSNSASFLISKLVPLPARRHACRKGGEPSHKSKMEDLTVEVCGENGAYYKVRSVESIENVERKSKAVDSTCHEPWRASNITLHSLVLRESAHLKCSRGNAASSDAMSRLTGRDFS